MDAFIRYAVVASESAIKDSGIKNDVLSDEDLDRIIKKYETV
jgi:3-oxoacyl-(acyl-carrier-protein) synthase